MKAAPRKPVQASVTLARKDFNLLRRFAVIGCEWEIGHSSDISDPSAKDWNAKMRRTERRILRMNRS